MTGTEKDDAARELAEWHFKVEPFLEKVVRIFATNEHEPEEPIKLLEINGASVALSRVEPFAFAASEAIPFPVTVAEVTPEEFERIERGEIKLPEGWSLDTAVSFERPRAA